MSSNVKTINGKKRARLGTKRYQPKMSDENRDKVSKAVKASHKERIKNAPKQPNGKIVPAYRVKQLLSTQEAEEHGIVPTVKTAAVNPRASKPLFVRKPKIGDQLVKLIGEGYPYITACRYVGIGYDTFIKWLQIGHEGLLPHYRKFYKRIARAEARSEMKRLKNVRRHQKTDWRASAWELERRYPEHWAKRDGQKARVEVTATINVNKKEDLSKAVLRDQQAKDLARKLIEGDEFGYTEVKAEE